jgi:putative ATP-binding cassette transporter
MHIEHPTAIMNRLTQHVVTRSVCLRRTRPGLPAMRMLRLLGMVFWTPKRWRAFGLVAAVIVVTVAMVLLMLRFTTWNAEFFDVIEQKSLPGLLRQSVIFGAILIAVMIVNVAQLEAKRGLQIELRSFLTHSVIDVWMAEGRHYRLRDMQGDHGNEDGRIAEDARVTSEMVVEFFSSLLYALLQLVLFVGVLWINSGPLALTVGRFAVTIPGHMVWVAIMYAATGAAITIFVGRPLVRATDRRQATEADFRAQLVEAIGHAPAIALARVEAGERHRLLAAFDMVRATWSAQTTYFRTLIFMSSGYGILTGILPLLVLAPRHFSGEISLGTLMLVSLAFSQVTGALSWLSDSYPNLAQWEASAERVLALNDAVTDVVNGACDEGSGRIQRLAVNGPGLAFRNVTVVSPTGEVIVDRLDAEVRPGERVLVEATSQAATALFRVVAGLWPWGAGRIELPDNSVPFFVADRPYLPRARLGDLLVEPEKPTRFANEAIAETLVEVGLAHLVPRLGQTDLWEQSLTLDEQQRFGFARVLLHRPQWILMHDATGALDTASEGALMELLIRRLPNSSIVTIAHQTTIERYHQRRISLTSIV